jgi:hypothetical protein
MPSGQECALSSCECDQVGCIFKIEREKRKKEKKGRHKTSGQQTRKHYDDSDGCMDSKIDYKKTQS